MHIETERAFYERRPSETHENVVVEGHGNTAGVDDAIADVERSVGREIAGISVRCRHAGAPQPIGAAQAYAT